MKKRLGIFLALMTAMSFSSGCSARESAEYTEYTQIILTVNQPDMTVNGTEYRIDPEGTVPVIVNGRTFLPVRAVTEAMGGTAEWDGTTETVTLRRNQDIIRLIIGSETAYLNDAPKSLDIAPMMIGDRTMLPIRFIAESFHFHVEWNEENQRVKITEEIPNENKPGTPTDPESQFPTESAEKTQTPSVPNRTQITVNVNGQVFTAALENNETAKAFYTMLPLTLNMDEMNGNEKYYYLDQNLPTNSKRVDKIHTGDLMLYGSNCVVSFFDTFNTSYTYTPIGHIDDARGYAAALPSGSVTITFSQ